MFKSGLVCIVLVVCCSIENEAAITEAQKSQIQTHMLGIGLDCLKDHNVNFEHLRAFRERKVPDDEGAKCFINCVFKKLGIMDESGKYSAEVAKENAKKVFKEGDENLPKVEELLQTCYKVNDHEVSDGEKGCDRASLAFKCFVKHAPKVGLDVDF